MTVFKRTSFAILGIVLCGAVVYIAVRINEMSTMLSLDGQTMVLAFLTPPVLWLICIGLLQHRRLGVQ